MLELFWLNKKKSRIGLLRPEPKLRLNLDYLAEQKRIYSAKKAETIFIRAGPCFKFRFMTQLNSLTFLCIWFPPTRVRDSKQFPKQS